METLRPFLEKIADGENLTRDEASRVLEKIISESVTPGEVGAFLMGLRMKGESVEEILGFVDTMEQNMLKVNLLSDDAIDVCGTGGDNTHSFNVSTASAFVVSAGGVPVAKHGNRSVSSKCGSADVLETLGVNIHLGPEEVLSCIREGGLGFLFAPRYHPAMKAVLPHRKNLGLRTIFNMLGPLVNPAGVRRQLVGTYNRETAKKLAEVLLMKGHTKACTVYSEDGFDEVSPFASNDIYEIDNGRIKEYVYHNRTIPANGRDSIRGKNSRENAHKITTLLSGEKDAARDMTVLNAAFGFYVAGMVEKIPDGILLAEEMIDSGAALKKLHNLIELSRRYAKE
jgi:anthranilate phosphoribosyltransferase